MYSLFPDARSGMRTFLLTVVPNENRDLCYEWASMSSVSLWIRITGSSHPGNM